MSTSKDVFDDDASSFATLVVSPSEDVFDDDASSFATLVVSTSEDVLKERLGLRFGEGRFLCRRVKLRILRR